MIYLTFDSNIWIYSLDDSWKIENQLDYLELWIEENHIKLLLPEIILQEWKNHREKEVEKREKTLNNFFEMADEILPSAFFSDYKKPEVQKEIILNQLTRIDSILEKAEIIPTSTEIDKKIIEWGIAKKAPMHKKTSVADAIIILSLFEFAELKNGNTFFFVSDNKEDFYENGKIHSHLKPFFERLSIKEFRKLNILIDHLRYSFNLPINNTLEQKRKERIKNKLKEKAYNPEYEKITVSQESSFIINLNTLDFILKETKPTKEQIIFVLALIDSDKNYEREFYKRLSNANWFKILKNKGVFNHTNNPLPIQTEEGFQTPFWESLVYLEKLSNQIKEGKEIELTDEIIEIIKKVSESSIKNDLTWVSFIKILSKLPNEKISKEILNLIPVWLNSNFNTRIQTMYLCDELLPKFLYEQPINEDIEKGELILKYLFSIDKKKETEYEDLILNKVSYYSKVYLPYLKHTLIDNKHLSKIALYYSNSIAFFIANNLKKIYSDFPQGINGTINSNKKLFSIKVQIEDANLSVTLKEKDNDNSIENTEIIENFEEYNEEQIKEKLISIIKENTLDYSAIDINELNIGTILDLLKNGSDYSVFHDSISELNDSYHQNETVKDVFSLIFRDLLYEKFVQNPTNGVQLLKQFALDNSYRINFFRRVSLYIIGDNWEMIKVIFWEMIKDNDCNHYFSNYLYDKDIYMLLNNCQFLFTETEINQLQSIIEFGPQNEDFKGNIDYWKLRWYSALRRIEPFHSNYIQLSEKLDITHEKFEKNGIVRSGSVSPFSMDDIMQKNNVDIVAYILNFRQKNQWEEPNIDGLSEILGNVAEKDPLKISDEIGLYKDVYYIYIYRILYGFKNAWKNKKIINWKNVLIFCKEYITNEKFYSDKLIIENDSWNANSEWVVGSIASLLTEGMKSDNNAFDKHLMPLAKEILQILVTNLKTPKDMKQDNMNYPTYTANSTAGKVLRAVLDYSLRRARNLNTSENIQKWEEDVSLMFEETLKKGIIDGFILTGWYFQQFYFLDKEWLSNLVKENYNLENKKWSAFMGGFAFSNPPFNKETYQLFYPHYERAINNNIEFSWLDNPGLIRHIVSFYFWEYEDLNKEGLMLLFINKAKPSSILELVNFIWRQENYLKSLSEEDVNIFENIIFNLWDFLACKYDKSEDNEEQKVLAGLLNLLEFVPQLNKINTALVLKSSNFSEEYFHTYNLIKNLTRLMRKGNSIETAKYIGEILNSIPFKEYLSSNDEQNISDLVTFLFKNEQKEIAAEFCEKMVKKGYEFLIEIYNKNKD